MKFYKFTFTLALSLIVLLALLPLSALATNILSNSGLNDPYLDIPGRTYSGQAQKIASGWQPFYIATGPYATYAANENAKKLYWMSSVQFALAFHGGDYHIEGNRAQNMWSSYQFDAGIYQQISGVTPGQGYGFDMAMVTYWRGPGYPDSDGKMIKQVGIDPTGGTDPTSSSVIWSSTDANDKAWIYLDVAATAKASTITVFARVQAGDNQSVNHTDLDMAYFEAAHVAPVPTTTLTTAVNGTTVNLTWSGSGVAPSWSLKGYEVQYRDQTSSSWTALQSKNSTGASGAFAGQQGHTYLVRARTWQQINESYQSGIDMPGDWRQQTVTLGALVSGRVANNQGAGVGGITVSEVSSGISAITGDDGLFSLGLAGSGTYTFTIPRTGAGWSAPPPMQVSVQLTSTPFLTFTLRPPDNIITNGDFENGLTGWQVSGTVPTNVVNGHRSGSASLLLSDTVSLSQTSLISGSYQPILSFWYKVEGSDGNDTFTADILGSDILSLAPKFSTTANTDWQQVWLPLNLTELYTGPVGVQFNLTQSGGSQASVYLDEVSLGASWGGPNEVYLPAIVK